MNGPQILRIAPEALIDRPARSARATLRDDLVDEYAEALRGGAEFPPPTAFTDGAAYWLADGRHRVAAHREALPGEPIEVAVLQGGEADALRHALRANAAHGLRRSPGDLQAAYSAAVAAGLVQATDAAAVREALGCSRATAFRLTQQARASDQQRRDTMISGLRGGGASQREVAAATGLSQQALSARERRNTTKSHEKNLSRETGSPPPPRTAPMTRSSPPPAGAMHTVDEIARRVRALALIDPDRVAAALPPREVARIRQAATQMQTWSTAFLAALSGPGAGGAPCPRCDGEGCPACEPGARP